MDYTREAFTFPAGNVRVTLDYDIRTGLDCTAMLDTGCVTVPVPGEPAILEVKWVSSSPTSSGTPSPCAACAPGPSPNTPPAVPTADSL